MAVVNNTGLPKKFLKGKDDIIYGRVIDVILDRHHPAFTSYDDVGMIFFQKSTGKIYKRKIPTDKSNLNNLPTARPLHPNSRYIPLKNEIVALYVGIGATEHPTVYYSSVINVWNHPHHNALPTKGELAALNASGGNDDYDVTGTGIQRRSEDGDTGINLGLYYSESLAIKPLIPFEGDFLLEGRFGNSIRFGSTNNSENLTVKNHWSSGDVKTGDPITIIRNGQKGIRVPANEQEEIKGWEPTLEDPNGDDSIIFMTSNQVITDIKVAGLTDSEEPWITSWPSFGSEDIKEVQGQTTQDADQQNDETEDMTDEELNQAAAGEDELAQSPTDVDNPEEDDIRYFNQLPDTDEEAENLVLKQFCDYLFGTFCYLPLCAGVNKIFKVYEEMVQGKKYYYPELENDATHYITKDKLYEILVYYDIQISHKPNPMMKLAKKAMQIGWLNSPNWFRPHMNPFNSTLHLPSVEATKIIFKKPTQTEDELKFIDEVSRTMTLDSVWAELAHVADIDINGFFGYVKDDWKNLTRGIMDLDGKREKNKNIPEGMLIPKNSMYLKEDMRGIKIYVDEEETATGTKCFISVKDIPGNYGTEKLEIEFEPNTSRNVMEKRMAEITSNMLREDHEINLRLIYQDITIINQVKYDDLNHYEGRTHQIVEPQLANEWLGEHDGRDECKKARIVHVSAMTLEDAEEAYKEEIQTQGETEDSKPPVKYQNTETGVFHFRAEDWPEVEAIRDQTDTEQYTP